MVYIYYSYNMRLKKYFKVSTFSYIWFFKKVRHCSYIYDHFFQYTFKPPEQLTTFESGKNTEL